MWHYYKNQMLFQNIWGLLNSFINPIRHYRCLNDTFLIPIVKYLAFTTINQNSNVYLKQVSNFLSCSLRTHQASKLAIYGKNSILSRLYLKENKSFVTHPFQTLIYDVLRYFAALTKRQHNIRHSNQRAKPNKKYWLSLSPNALTLPRRSRPFTVF